MTARLTTLPVALLACVAGAPAGAEQERVDGMGRNVSRFEELQPGDRIRVTGPIDGQATRITRP